MHQFNYSLKSMLRAHLKPLTPYGGASKQRGELLEMNELNDDRREVT